MGIVPFKKLLRLWHLKLFRYVTGSESWDNQCYNLDILQKYQKGWPWKTWDDAIQDDIKSWNLIGYMFWIGSSGEILPIILPKHANLVSKKEDSKPDKWKRSSTLSTKDVWFRQFLVSSLVFFMQVATSRCSLLARIVFLRLNQWKSKKT